MTGREEYSVKWERERQTKRFRDRMSKRRRVRETYAFSTTITSATPERASPSGVAKDQCLPHFPQKLLSIDTSVPHCEQNIVAGSS